MYEVPKSNSKFLRLLPFPTVTECSSSYWPSQSEQCSLSPWLQLPVLNDVDEHHGMTEATTDEYSTFYHSISVRTNLQYNHPALTRYIHRITIPQHSCIINLKDTEGDQNLTRSQGNHTTRPMLGMLISPKFGEGVPLWSLKKHRTGSHQTPKLGEGSTPCP